MELQPDVSEVAFGRSWNLLQKIYYLSLQMSALVAVDGDPNCLICMLAYSDQCICQSSRVKQPATLSASNLVQLQIGLQEQAQHEISAVKA